MTAAARHDLRELIRWAACGVVVLAAHGLLGATFLPTDDAAENAEQSGGFVVELAEIPVTRPDIPLDVAPGPDMVQSPASPEILAEKPADKTEDTPEPKPEDEPLPQLAPAPEPEAVLPVAVKETKESEQQPSQPLSPAPATTATQAVGDIQGPVAMAPVQAAPNVLNSDRVANWQSRLRTLLERNKRYPGAAEARREHGVVLVAFVVDPGGKLMSSRVERTSGYAALDAEALELLTRVQPFPVPPPELAGVQVNVPVRFKLR